MMRMIDARKKFTARELAVQFDVSIRTIQRDLDYLQQMGFPLYTEVGPNGGYRVLPNRILPPLQLTQYEAFGLFLLIKVLEKIPDFPFASVRSHLADQYYASLPTDIQDTIDRMNKHMAFNQQPSLASAPFTTKILEAAIDKKELGFLYQSTSGMKKSQAYPLGIYFENGYWYMPATSHQRVLLYRVDRIHELEVLKQIDDSLPTLQEWMSSKDERESEDVVLHFTSLGERLSQSDSMFQSKFNHEWHGRVPLEEFPFVARKLLKFGPEVKVVSPQKLQELVVEMLSNSLRQYECNN
jgi:predicted DNA-binding transcriptional regulator YafY